MVGLARGRIPEYSKTAGFPSYVVSSIFFFLFILGIRLAQNLVYWTRGIKSKKVPFFHIFENRNMRLKIRPTKGAATCNKLMTLYAVALRRVVH